MAKFHRISRGPDLRYQLLISWNFGNTEEYLRISECLWYRICGRWPVQFKRCCQPTGRKRNHNGLGCAVIYRFGKLRLSKHTLHRSESSLRRELQILTLQPLGAIFT